MRLYRYTIRGTELLYFSVVKVQITRMIEIQHCKNSHLALNGDFGNSVIGGDGQFWEFWTRRRRRSGSFQSCNAK
jgi:hypothetical protein